MTGTQSGIHLPASAEEKAGWAPGPGHSTGQRRPGYVYVASSWRNPLQPAVMAALRAAEIPAYDFRNPEGGTGFHWSEVDLTYTECRCDHARVHGICRAHGEARRDGKCGCPFEQTARVDGYLAALEHPRSIAGFNSDFEAMQRADTFVLVLPCGRSAHLELGWAVGAGKCTAILLEDPCTPELMYRMVDYLAPSLFDLLGWLGVED